MRKYVIKGLEICNGFLLLSALDTAGWHSICFCRESEAFLAVSADCGCIRSSGSNCSRQWIFTILDGSLRSDRSILLFCRKSRETRLLA